MNGVRNIKLRKLRRENGCNIFDLIVGCEHRRWVFVTIDIVLRGVAQRDPSITIRVLRSISAAHGKKVLVLGHVSGRFCRSKNRRHKNPRTTPGQRKADFYQLVFTDKIVTVKRQRIWRCFWFGPRVVALPAEQLGKTAAARNKTIL